MIWHFMQIVSVYEVWVFIYLWKIKKENKIIGLSSIEFAHSMLSISFIHFFTVFLW